MTNSTNKKEQKVELPFHDLNAEMALLCCLASDKDSYIDVSHFLKPQHFYVQAASDAYKAFLEMANGDTAPDYAAWVAKLTADSATSRHF